MRPKLADNLPCRLAVSLLGLVSIATAVHAQPALQRLPVDTLDVRAPFLRVAGEPGQMHVRAGECAARGGAGLRRRIVDIAIQEWAFFGFKIVDQTFIDERQESRPRPRRRQPWLGPSESARVATSIAGYWSVTPDGSWILNRQNAIWNGPMGVAARWRDPWSAAFISWVMCESGLAEPARFERAIAHHVYIDQAIESTGSAYVAYDVGERPIEPGDLVCSGRRPAYRSIEDRRSQIGVGARTHCDIVVAIDPERDRILTIGGNVRGSVTLKLMAAEAKPGPADAGLLHESVGLGRRVIFAHLKLAGDSIGPDGFAGSPTMQTLNADVVAYKELQSRLGLAVQTAASSDCCDTTPATVSSGG